MDDTRKHIARVFFVLTSFRECSEFGTLIRNSRNANMKDAIDAITSDNSILKTTLMRPGIRKKFG